ncbi:MAG: replication-relaxation family protein, partial [Candidatus Dadabacteria bacterium]|nr:replication-relaxation family protein [Candidatus Dadabacteria bacterium]
MQEKRRAWTERIPHERLELSPRDIEILRSVYTYRFLTSSQLTKMFFPSKSFADRRLRKLYDHGFLDRIQRPVTEGKCELLYALWTEGARVLSRKIKISREELGWSKSKNRVGGEFLEHELEVTQFRLALEEACRNNNGYSLKEWRNKEELKLKKGNISYGEKIRDRGKSIILIPDAYFVLHTPKGIAHFFLEIDRYTETASKVFRRKMHGYKMYFERGLFRDRFGGKNFRVLTVTTN